MCVCVMEVRRRVVSVAYTRSWHTVYIRMRACVNGMMEMRSRKNQVVR